MSSAAALDVPFDGRALADLRGRVAACLEDADVPIDVEDAAVLVVNELATNAIRHAGDGGRLQLWITRRFITCRVTDRGGGMAASDTVGTVRPPLAALGGRGIWIARRLSRWLDITTGPAGTTVTAVIDR